MRLERTGGKSGEAYVKPKAKALPRLKAEPEASDYTLPEPDDAEEKQPLEHFGLTTSLFHGEYKIGKTATAMECPDPLLLAFEPGGSAISPNRQREILNWKAFKAYKRLLKESDRFRTIVVDTADVAYDMCFEYGCKTMNVQHPSDGNFGDVWDFIRKEFHDEMSDLMRIGRGVIFISHTETAEFQSRSGGSYNKLIPTMGKRPREFVTGVADSTLFFGYHGEERVITLQGSDDLEAGTRLKYNWWVKDQYRVQRVHSIPMGENEVECYANLERAFLNQQETDGKPESGRVVLAETRVVKPKRR